MKTEITFREKNYKYEDEYWFEVKESNGFVNELEVIDRNLINMLDVISGNVKSTDQSILDRFDYLNKFVVNDNLFINLVKKAGLEDYYNNFDITSQNLEEFVEQSEEILKDFQYDYQEYVKKGGNLLEYWMDFEEV